MFRFLFIATLLFESFSFSFSMNDLGKRVDEVKRAASVCASFATAALQNGSAVYGGAAGIISFSIGSMAAEYGNLIDGIHRQKQKLQEKYYNESPYIKHKLNEEYKDICKYIIRPTSPDVFPGF